MKKYLKSIYTEKGLVPKLYKKLLKHSEKANNLIFFNGQNLEQTFNQRRFINGKLAHTKIAQHQQGNEIKTIRYKYL